MSDEVINNPFPPEFADLQFKTLMGTLESQTKLQFEEWIKFVNRTKKEAEAAKQYGLTDAQVQEIAKTADELTVTRYPQPSRH